MTSDTTPTISRANPPELGSPPGYSPIVEIAAGRIVFISGQTAVDADGNVVGKNDFAAQAERVPQSFDCPAGTRMVQGCSCRSGTRSASPDWRRCRYREARNRFFATVTPPAAPAVTLVEVSKFYGPDFMIEIEAIAAA
jgi:enamine deaminase RidA (YjgF/YER057c/UK114 family)